MNIVFFGSDDFAETHLKALIEAKHDIVACVTQPDRPKGRGMKVVISPIKECAQKNNITVLQPVDLNDESFQTELQSLDADLFIVIAYGMFLPQNVLNIPKVFALNVHGSLLPKYRGAAPINWAIINGEKETGVTIIKLNTAMDAGDIVAKDVTKIESNDTAAVLREKMKKQGASLLLKTLEDISTEKYSFEAQDKNLVTKAPKLTKDLGKIDWNKPAQDIHNLVRGLIPWPTAYTSFKGKMLKILESEVIQEESTASAGEITTINKSGFIVATGRQSLFIKKVHLESAKPMDARSFVNGHGLEVGTQLCQS